MALFLITGCAFGPLTNWRRVAPWSGVRFDGEDVDVLLGADWFRLEAIDGCAIEDVTHNAREEFGGQWQERFVEDICEVLSVVGRWPGKSVSLQLRTQTGEEVQREELMTFVKREAARQRFEREEGDRELSRRLSRDEAIRDLSRLQKLIDERFAYRDLAGVNVESIFQASQEALPEDIELRQFGLRLWRLMARFGDAHSRIQVPLDHLLPRGYLPFLVEKTEAGLVAFREERDGLLDPNRPFLVTLDGRPIEDWLEAAAPLVTRGSPSFVMRHTARTLRWIGWLRLALAIPPSSTIEVRLADAFGQNPRTITMELWERPPLYGEWPRTETRALDDGIGYLRIPRMDDGPKAVRSLNRAMTTFSQTRGLIIDVRGNGGGTRTLLMTIAPWFLDREEARVGNVAAYRLEPGAARAVPGGYLTDRFLRPAGDPSLSDIARTAIASAAASFEAEWKPSEPAFSEWHWLVMERATNTRAGRYVAPVVILTDAGCFSATDIFVAALAELPQVTLVGTPTGGGSGRSRPYRLQESGLVVRLSSMASFRPDGRCYDGRGVSPDVLVEPDPADFVGGSDRQLLMALEVINKAAPRRASQ